MPSSSCATTLAQLAFGPVNTFSVFYAKSLGMSMQAYGSHLAFSFKVSLVLSFFLGWLADKLHQLRLGIVAAYALWAGAYALTPAAFAFAFVAHNILSGTYFTATASIGQRLYPSLAFALLALAGLLVVHRYFMRLGGPKNYTAP